MRTNPRADFLPRQSNPEATKPLLFWLIRRVEVRPPARRPRAHADAAHR